MPQHLVIELIDLLHDHITAQGSTRIPVHLQVLCALRFFVEGGYQKGVGNDFKHPVSQATFSRCLNRVVIALSILAPQWITFPQTREERQELSNRFLQYNAIPGIIGLIDCFVVKFIRPPANEEAFFNHKHAHSMNIQVIRNDNYIIQNLRICPGSNNDKHLWRYSNIRQELLHLRNVVDIVRSEGNYYILDSGYTPSPILLTPIRNAPEGSPQARYTFQHMRTRCKVEQLFGVLSNVWLLKTKRRVMSYRPEKVELIIQACAVLHNFRRINGVLDDLPEPNLQVDRVR